MYYYPFAYTIFIQPYEEGCDGGEIRGLAGTALSLEELLTDLACSRVHVKARQQRFTDLHREWCVSLACTVAYIMNHDGLGP